MASELSAMRPRPFLPGGYDYDMSAYRTRRIGLVI